MSDRIDKMIGYVLSDNFAEKSDSEESGPIDSRINYQTLNMLLEREREKLGSSRNCITDSNIDFSLSSTANLRQGKDVNGYPSSDSAAALAREILCIIQSMQGKKKLNEKKTEGDTSTSSASPEPTQTDLQKKFYPDKSPSDMEDFPGLEDLFQPYLVDFSNEKAIENQIKRITSTEAFQKILFCLVAYLRNTPSLLEKKIIISTPEQVFHLLSKQHQLEEWVKVIYLNKRSEVLGCKDIALGKENVAFLSPKTIFRHAFKLGADRFILVHNHPGGSLAPSVQDLALTKRLKELAEIIGLQLIDHIILGNGYLSMLKKGLIMDTA